MAYTHIMFRAQARLRVVNVLESRFLGPITKAHIALEKAVSIARVPLLIVRPEPDAEHAGRPAAP